MVEVETKEQGTATATEMHPLYGELTYIAKGTTSYDLDGNGTLFEVGIGAEIVQSLRLEASFGKGKTKVEANSGKASGTLEVFDNSGVFIASGSLPEQVNEKWEFDVTTRTAMIDVNYVFTDLFLKDYPFSICAGLGIGQTYNTAKDDSGKSSSTAFAWRVNIGAMYAFNENWNVYSSYQYMDLGQIEDEYEDALNELDFVADIVASAFTIGINYTF